MTNKQKKQLELYIHIPFCARKCDYCDFLSFRTPGAVHEQYIEQLLGEIEVQGRACREYQVVSVFIGGGTPSVLEPVLIQKLMEALRRNFQVEEDGEITIEVNPGTLLQNKLHLYRSWGINRVSIGLQSANNEELKNLGRIHTFEEFLKSFQCARMAGFADINIDLMSGIPGQTLDSWKNTLKKVAMLKPEHISAYSLILEEGTPFWERYGQKRKGNPPLPDEELEQQLYQLTRDFLKAQGYERYEISNYARQGCTCRHNIGYWTGVPYLGLGLGASSFFENCRFINELDMEAYLKLDFLAEDQSETLLALGGPRKELTKQEQMEEFMFLGLRLIKGVSEIDFVARFGIRLETVYGPVIERLKEKGLLKQEGVWISLTEWGMDVSNHVLSEFLL